MEVLKYVILWINSKDWNLQLKIEITKSKISTI